MNRNQLKAYAPKARRDFIKAITDRAAYYGLTKNEPEPIVQEGDMAIIGGKPFPRSVAEKRERLEERIARQGFDQCMEAIAYTWFNRFVAIRYMELHGYLDHGYRVLSHPEGNSTPEILEHAEHVDLPGLDRDKVIELKLDGTKEPELYNMLLIAQCNALHKAMPFLFEHVDDETELLLPENLLHSDSLIRRLVDAIPEEEWQEVEIIGWIYQFYISEKKAQVIGKVVKSEDIPAATQLFTPNWIVKYMVQNTLGRKWLMTYPDSPIREKMKFYIEPVEQEPKVQAQLDAITPKELNPEELTFMDPACGSGHVLAEAYDLYKEIYLQRGYRPRDIPRLILEKNLYGLEIDDRAAQLARFTVLMKARADNRRVLDPENPVKLNVLAIQESKGMDADAIADVLLRERTVELGKPEQEQQALFDLKKSKQAYLTAMVKPDVTPSELFPLIHIFQNAKTYGSLITVPEQIRKTMPKIWLLLEKSIILDRETKSITEILMPIMHQLELLSKKYNFVVTNPPYMGNKGQNRLLKIFLKDNYPDAQTDLFSAFIVRNLKMSVRNAELGFMSPYVWMFISSYEKLRKLLISNKTITSLVQLEYSGFDGATVPICAYTLENTHLPYFNASYVRLSNFRGAHHQAPKTLEAIQNRDCGWYYTAAASSFKRIPGSPICYWLSEDLMACFSKGVALSEICEIREGINTGNNDLFLRFWYEADFSKLKFDAVIGNKSSGKWFPHKKGGSYRKWYGNSEIVINWGNNGKDIHDFHKLPMSYNGAPVRGKAFFFKESLAWSRVSSGKFSLRYYPVGFTYDSTAPSIFADNKYLHIILSLLNSKVAACLLEAISPTLDYRLKSLGKIPLAVDEKSREYMNIVSNAKKCIKIARVDYDLSEISWGFDSHAFFDVNLHQDSLLKTYSNFRLDGLNKIIMTKECEEENNSIFIKLYGLENVLNFEVSLNDITLTCNPSYRYAGTNSDERRDQLFRTDTIKGLISYSIGCMMGRYSLDEPGIIYAHRENEGFDPSCYKIFPADEDGIIPIMEENWFEDDSTTRFVEFLKVAWSQEILKENLEFIAESLSPKRGEAFLDTIRRYMATDFFKHHLSMYKKRPIYWLFSSGKLRAFQCLVYLHRYNEGTLSRMRTEYVIPLQGKINARIDQLKGDMNSASSTSHRKKLEKEKEKLLKQRAELQGFDEQLRHYADQRISLDLDDGVKVNYGKFGDLLAEVKAVTGKKA